MSHDPDKPGERWPRIVLHVDMDAFYAAIEQRDNPELRGKAVIVGGTGRRGVVSTASYEARKFGVHSAMPGFKAHELCPHGVFVPPRIAHYAAVSRQLMEIFDRYSPTVEPLSLDEAFLEMSGAERLFGAPRAMAEKLSADIRDELDLTGSVGVAANKFIAKIASDMQKPNGITVVAPGTEVAFLHPLPIEKIWGVGKRASESLRALGLRTIGDVRQYSLQVLEQKYGSFGTHIWNLAHGTDVRRVNRDRERKSIGSERTLATDISGRRAVRKRLVPLADIVARSLRKKGWRAQGVRLKLKYADFRMITRDRRLPEPVADAESLIAALDELMDRAELAAPIRLVGMAAFDLVEGVGPRQQNLFGAPVVQRERLETAMDAVDARFGSGAIVRGASLERKPGGAEVHPAMLDTTPEGSSSD